MNQHLAEAAADLIRSLIPTPPRPRTLQDDMDDMHERMRRRHNEMMEDLKITRR